MIPPRWRKVWADLWTNRTRTILTVLSIAVGVLTAGAISFTYSILQRDMDASFRAINPAGAALSASLFDGEFLGSLRQMPELAQVEGRTHLSGFRVQAGEVQPVDMELWANPNFDKSALDRLILHEGDWPGDREVVVERNGLWRMPVAVGDSVQVTMSDGKLRTLRVAGTVEDRSIDSANPNIIGYITVNTLEYLGQARSLNYVLMSAAEHPEDQEHVRAVARLVEEQFRRNGGAVNTTLVRDPGRHPNSQQVATITALLAAVGLLTILLSGLLVINTMSALMAKQIRYVGMMKAVGARTSQIFGMYVVFLLCLGAMAFVLAAPLGLAGGYSAAQRVAAYLNFTISPFRLEPLPLAVMGVLSLAVPLLAGLVPVLGGARVTIREAISGYGLVGGAAPGLMDRVLGRVRGLSRPLLISLRNAARRKARLALTLATLVLAGAMFMSVLSAQASMAAGLAQNYRYYTGDVNAEFEARQRVANIQDMLRDVPGVARLEGWIFAGGEVMPREGGIRLREDRVAIDRMTVTGAPMDSAIMPRDVVAGRWLLPGDENAIVMCTSAMRAHPDWLIGSTVTLRLNSQREADFVIVGTFPFGSGEGNKMALAKYEYLADLLNQPGQARDFRIVTFPHDAAAQDRVRDALTARFKAAGYRAAVTSGHTEADALNRILSMIIAVLLAVASLIGLVGALGLMGTMSMNVMERTREIGVMRSIGATNGAIMQLVVVEGVLTGLLSWLGGALLGIPIGKLMAAILGGLFGTPFDLVVAPAGILIWLAVVVVLSVVASILPAWNASRLTIREGLAYE